jgi:hypothetical protein
VLKPMAQKTGHRKFLSHRKKWEKGERLIDRKS